jgi:hypothetical protein
MPSLISEVELPSFISMCSLRRRRRRRGGAGGGEEEAEEEEGGEYNK